MKSFLLSWLFLLPVPALAAVNIVTTTEDLASLAREVGGDLVNVEAIAKGYQDVHFVEAKPSYFLKMKKADLFIQIGLEQEVAWAPQLVAYSRNPKIRPGQLGFLDAHEGCDILNVPKGAVDRHMGDVHPHGNTHYWLDPRNGLIVAQNIAERLTQIDAGNASAYRKNYKEFEIRFTEKSKEWDQKAAALRGTKVVTYHDSWPNFAKRFGLEIVGFVEPRPGVPPSPAHVQSLEAQIKQTGVALILVEPYYDLKLPKKISADTGATVVSLYPSVGGKPEIKTYFGLFDYDLKLLMEALRQRSER